MSEVDESPIAVIDWGIGGLGVYREIKRIDPGRAVIYISDSGSAPYGKLSVRALRDRVATICEALQARAIRDLVIACNAASTVAPYLRARFGPRGLRIVDVIAAGVGAVRQTRYRRIGVLGGTRTIRSQIYQRALRTARRQVIGRIAQPLSALIERGVLDGEAMTAALRTILTPLRDVDALLLACTHYPAIAPLIAKVLPRCVLLDPARRTAELAVGRGSHRGPRAADRFFTTGDAAQSRRSAGLAFGIEGADFRAITLAEFLAAVRP